jgi:hypothetical protein
MPAFSRFKFGTTSRRVLILPRNIQLPAEGYGKTPPQSKGRESKKIPQCRIARINLANQCRLKIESWLQSFTTCLTPIV